MIKNDNGELVAYWYRIVYVTEAPFQVHLKVPRYVLVKRNVTFKCEYNAPFDHIHKVEWLKGDRKLFHYVKGRNPPFYNFTIPGGKINVSLWVFTKLFNLRRERKIVSYLNIIYYSKWWSFRFVLSFLFLYVRERVKKFHNVSSFQLVNQPF